MRFYEERMPSMPSFVIAGDLHLATMSDVIIVGVPLGL